MYSYEISQIMNVEPRSVNVGNLMRRANLIRANWWDLPDGPGVFAVCQHNLQNELLYSFPYREYQVRPPQQNLICSQAQNNP